ncbi:DUF4260 domain-containing protein [Lichenihabitans sp. Uapishka_5]|uniref:DUF4260 domain-containing protein n=1 Tax=Lichenihabitans sp. Uapishka_5 TaxID=3037302 RepID=UPI0029E7ED00|nr:DUF4260 domain-containing protein [Lichenihabitans sp. Uapishka_5]MDX7952465.1 DUF4260 domain-containing protein [Lichenihabitans sp. Uapishka_5]
MPGIVTGHPNLFLRAEGLAVLVLAVLTYATAGTGWLLFAVLVMLPDVSMLGYLAGPRVGAAAYNLAHWYVWPLLLLGIGTVQHAPVLFSIGLIWMAHIGFDRLIKAGFKYPEGFRFSHLGGPSAPTP